MASPTEVPLHLLDEVSSRFELADVLSCRLVCKAWRETFSSCVKNARIDERSLVPRSTYAMRKRNKKAEPKSKSRVCYAPEEAWPAPPPVQQLSEVFPNIAMATFNIKEVSTEEHIRPSESMVSDVFTSLSALQHLRKLDVVVSFAYAPSGRTAEAQASGSRQPRPYLQIDTHL